MTELTDGAQPTSLVIRGSAGQPARLALGSLVCIGVGGLMLMASRAGSTLLGRAQAVLGWLVALCGGLALGTLAYGATRPILLLYPDRLVDVRRRLTVPFTEIRPVVFVPRTGGFLARWLNPQWLLLYMRHPDKYAALERLSKRSGLSAADLTLDLSLASAVNCVWAQQFIQAQLLPIARGSKGLAGTTCRA